MISTQKYNTVARRNLVSYDFSFIKTIINGSLFTLCVHVMYELVEIRRKMANRDDGCLSVINHVSKLNKI